MRAASHGAPIRSATTAMTPVPNATAVLSAMMRPARSVFVARSSATYFVAVKPRPIPANTPNMPTVLWIMPYSPKCSRPSIRAVMTDAAKFEPCDMSAPKRDHTAPLVNRPRSESAAHMSRIALVPPSHDLSSVGIRSNLFASESLLQQSVPAEQPFRRRAHRQFFRWRCRLHRDCAGEPSSGRRGGHPGNCSAPLTIRCSSVPTSRAVPAETASGRTGHILMASGRVPKMKRTLVMYV